MNPLRGVCATGRVPPIPRLRRQPRARFNTDAQSELPELGQPMPWTHPHLLRPGEVTPGISAVEYDLRRFRVLQDLPDGAVAVVPGYQLRYKANGIFYPFAQHANLFYLTGFLEPQGALLLVKDQRHHKKYRSVLCVPHKDAGREMWDGRRTGVAWAPRAFHVDRAVPLRGWFEEVARAVHGALAARAPVLTDVPIVPPPRTADAAAASERAMVQDVPSTAAVAAADDMSFGPAFRGALLPSAGVAARFFDAPQLAELERGTAVRVEPLSPRLDRLRLFKSDAELALMREAGRATGRAFAAAMRATSPAAAEPLLTEHQLQATLEYHARMRGCDRVAFAPVVAGGANALVLHYVQNQQALRPGELVLVDAGAEFGGYASDVARTWPVRSRFSPAQRRVYDAVLRVQCEALQLCRENARVSLHDIHVHVAQRLHAEAEAVLQVRLRPADMQRYFPHATGHYLGLDVHDTPSVSRHERLLAGMVVAIEPGLYFPADDPRVPPAFRGIGVRIEDNVAVGATQPVVLSTEAPKEPSDIEAL